MLASTRAEADALLSSLRAQLASACHEIDGLQGQVAVLKSRVGALDVMNTHRRAVEAEAGLGVGLSRGGPPSPGFPASRRPSTAATARTGKSEATPVPAVTLHLAADGVTGGVLASAGGVAGQAATPRGSAVTAIRATTALPPSRGSFGGGDWAYSGLPSSSSAAVGAPAFLHGKLDTDAAKAMLASTLAGIGLGAGRRGHRAGGRMTTNEASAFLSTTAAHVQASFDLEEASKRGIVGSAGGLGPGSPKPARPAVTRVASVVTGGGAGGGRTFQPVSDGVGAPAGMAGGGRGGEPAPRPSSPSKAFTSAFQAQPAVDGQGSQESLMGASTSSL